MQRNSFLRAVSIDLTAVVEKLGENPEKQAENAVVFVRRQRYENIMNSLLMLGI
jgi:hypothetical protein